MEPGVVETCLAAAALLVTLAPQAMGRELLVPGIYATISDGIAAAVDGDTVLIAPGTYSGMGNTHFRVEDRSLTIRGSGFPGDVVIAGPTIDDWSAVVVASSSSSDRVVLESLRFEDLVLAWGVLVAVGNCQVEMTDCAVVDCGSTVELPPLPGAVLIRDFCKLTALRCTFERNMTYGWSGGGAVTVADNASARFDGCTFDKNYSVAGDGGALLCVTSKSVELNDCVLSRNTAYQGGAVGARSGEARLKRCLIVQNGAESGGGVYAGGETSAGRILLEGCTITRNSASWGGGVRVDSPGPAGLPATMDVTMSILRDNCDASPAWGRDAWVGSNGALTLQCCCLSEDGLMGSGPINYNGSQVWHDPWLCDPPDCDPYYSAEPSGYELSQGSPCTAANSPCGTEIGALGVGCGALPIGACCTGAECVEVDPATCHWLPGVYSGDGTLCDPSPCVSTPVEKMTWGKVKSRFGGR